MDALATAPTITHWRGNDLTGRWHFTIKIDGIRMDRDEAGQAVTRAGGHIHGLPANAAPVALAELYCGSWGETISRHQSRQPFAPDEVYSLDPIDPRLHIGYYVDPSAELIRQVMDLAVSRGAEGLVLRQGRRWIKVKKKLTVEVRVTGLDIGPGGRLRAFITDYGRIGTMNERDRYRYAQRRYIGSMIECGCTEITANCKLRDSYFIRPRPDKK